MMLTDRDAIRVTETDEELFIFDVSDDALALPTLPDES
jgi:hypothetical protein